MSKQFARLLTSAVKAISRRERIQIAIVQDELGIAMDRDSGSAVEYWRNGHIPAKLSDLEQLTRELVRRNGLNRTECRNFLRYGEHPAPEPLLDHLFSLNKLGQLDVVRSKFIVGPPITTPRQFYGRERELMRLFSLWSDLPLEHAAIKGLRRSGKTSLLYYLKHITSAGPYDLRPGQRADYLTRPCSIRWILLDFQNPQHRRQERLFRHLLRSLGIPQPDPCNQENFLEAMAEHLQWPVIILMDELEAGLASPELDKSFWMCLRSLANHYAQGRLAYVLTAGEVPLKLARLQESSSSFFNIFQQVELGPLTEEEARQLVGSSSRPFAAEETDWIVETSGRWPCLVQLLCKSRLLALDEGQTGNGWREEAVGLLEPYGHLFQ